MQRIAFVTAIALLILQQSNCLALVDGKLINRCGVWQFFTKSSLVLLVEEKKDVRSLITYNSDPVAVQSTKLYSCYSGIGSQYYRQSKPCEDDIITSNTPLIVRGSVTTSSSTSATTNTIIIPTTRTMTAFSYTGSISAATIGIGSYGNSNYQGRMIYCPGNNNVCTYNER